MIRRLSTAALFVFLAPLALRAAEAPKGEIFGGYSYFRATEPTTFNLNGWNGAVTANFNRWLGATADFSGQYGGPGGFVFSVLPIGVSAQQHSALFGPHVAFRSGRVTPFAHALFGLSRAKLGAFGLGISDSSYASAFGGGVDMNLTDHVAVRLIQADYFTTHFLGSRQDNTRLSFGVVFNFGGKR